MKRLFIIALALSLTAVTTAFSSCGSKREDDTDKLQIVSTIFPSYDFAKQICGDKADVTILLPPGAESHSYEPTPRDIIKIQNCDLFIYIGGESDAWVEKILASMEKPVKTLKMIECVTALEEELVEGMEEEDDHEDGDKHEEEVEYDQHVWTSPKNAVKITEMIANKISSIDADNSSFYQAGKEAYIKKLEQVDKDFTDFFATVKNKTMIFGDRFPLRYFTEEYGIAYFAAFPGCSSGTEPSAATIKFLVDKVNAEKIQTVYYIEFSNHKVADSIAKTTGTKTALFHSCHNVSKEDLNKGVTYVTLMEQNLETLKSTMK